MAPPDLASAIDAFRQHETEVGVSPAALERSQVFVTKVRWAFLYGEGRVTRSGHELRFPLIPQGVAGVYCFELWGDANADSAAESDEQRTAVYVGEAEDIRARWDRYRRASQVPTPEDVSASDVQKAELLRACLTGPNHGTVRVRLVLWTEMEREDGSSLGYLPLMQQRVLRRLVEGTVIASAYAGDAGIFDNSELINVNPVAMKINEEAGPLFGP